MGTACSGGRLDPALLLSQADLCYWSRLCQCSKRGSSAKHWKSSPKPGSLNLSPAKLGHFSGNPTSRDSTQQFSKVETIAESHLGSGASRAALSSHYEVGRKLSNECFCWQLFLVSKRHQYNQCSPELPPSTVPEPCSDLLSREDRGVGSPGRTHQGIWECPYFSQPCLQTSSKWIKWVFYWQCSH